MKTAFTILSFFVAFTSFAQQRTADSVAVKTVHGTVLQLLNILSDNGSPTDWDAFRNLFLPTADLSAVTHDKTGEASYF